MLDFIALTRQESYYAIQIPRQQDELKMNYNGSTFSYEDTIK